MVGHKHFPNLFTETMCQSKTTNARRPMATNRRTQAISAQTRFAGFIGAGQKNERLQTFHGISATSAELTCMTRVTCDLLRDFPDSGLA